MTNTNSIIAGDVVESIFTNKRGTVTSLGGSGATVYVRWDGASQSLPFNATRVRRVEIETAEPTDTYGDRFRFKKGDYISAEKDGVVYKGAALNGMTFPGWALYKIETEEGEVVEFNYNQSPATVIFKARVARGEVTE